MADNINGNGMADDSQKSPAIHIQKPGAKQNIQQNIIKDPYVTIPHISTYAGYYAGANKSYYIYWEESLRNSQANSLAMRRDGVTEEFMNHRTLPIISCPHHIEVDDPEHPDQMSISETVHKIFCDIPRIKVLMKQLLEAVFYGRYGAQLQIGPRKVSGNTWNSVSLHIPINGDKFRYKFDGTPGIAIYAGDKEPKGDVTGQNKFLTKYKDYIDNTMLGPALFLYPQELRDRFVIHRYVGSDTDYLFEISESQSIFGLGMRSRLYWTWNFYTEILSWLTDSIQRIGASGLIYGFYPSGNAAAQREVINSLSQLVKDKIGAFPTPMGYEGKLSEWLQRIEASSVGYEVMERLLDRLMGIMRRAFLGQDLSSESKATGMGSGMADLHGDVRMDTIKFDCELLAETLTDQIVQSVILRYNKWKYEGKEISGDELPFSMKLKFDVDDGNGAVRLEAANQLFQMGVPLDMDDVRKAGGFSPPKKKATVLVNPQIEMANQQNEAGQPAFNEMNKSLKGIVGEGKKAQGMGMFGPKSPKAGGNGQQNGKPSRFAKPKESSNDKVKTSRFSDCGHTPSGSFSQNNICASDQIIVRKKKVEALRSKGHKELDSWKKHHRSQHKELISDQKKDWQSLSKEHAKELQSLIKDHARELRKADRDDLDSIKESHVNEISSLYDQQRNERKDRKSDYIIDRTSLKDTQHEERKEILERLIDDIKEMNFKRKSDKSRFSDCGHEKSGSFSINNTCATIKETADKTMGRLPPKVQRHLKRFKRIYSSSFDAANHAAKIMAKKRGYSREQVNTLSSILGAIDLVGSFAVGAGAGTAASFIPVASSAYLAYTASKHPMQTLAAARKAIRRTSSKISKFAKAGDADDCGHETPGPKGGKFTEGNTCAGDGSGQSSKVKKLYEVIEKIPYEKMKEKFEKHMSSGNLPFNPRKQEFIEAMKGSIKSKNYVKAIVPIKDMNIKAEGHEGEERYERSYSKLSTDMGASFVSFGEGGREDDPEKPLYVLDGNHRADARRASGKNSSPVFMTEEQYDDYMDHVKKEHMSTSGKLASESVGLLKDVVHGALGIEPDEDISEQSNKIISELKPIMEKSKDSKHEIDSLADKIADDVDHGSKVAKAPLKSQKRAIEKIKNDYGGDAKRITDIARNTIIVPSHVFDETIEKLKYHGASAKVVKHDDNPMGYSGGLSKIATKNGLTAEIQVNTPGMIYAKEPEEVSRAILGEELYRKIKKCVKIKGGMGHKFYEEYRSALPGDKARDKLEAKSQAYYKTIRESNC